MRIAVTGATGRVGAALVRYLSSRHQVVALSRKELNLNDLESLPSMLDRLDCDVFVNPAGLTSLEACEDDPAMARRINAEAPAEIVKWAATRDVSVFHFSTDYVFGGEIEGLRSETEATLPVNIYGLSKLAGEVAILGKPTNTVIRVSWVFGPEKPSFVDQVFDSAMAGRSLMAVADKFSLPVFTSDLAPWVACLIEQKATGIFHACNSGDPVSWHDMAIAVVEAMCANGVMPEIPKIEKQALDQMTSFRARRPRFTAMNTQRLTQALGYSPRPWQEAMAEYVAYRCSLV